jgi:very-short-patch-repair endonuclease
MKHYEVREILVEAGIEIKKRGMQKGAYRAPAKRDKTVWKAQLDEARQKRWENPEQHKRASQLLHDTWENDPEWRARHEKTLRRLWDDPSQPLYHWDDPGHRERQSQLWLRIIRDNNGTYVPMLETVLRNALKRAFLSFTAPAVVLHGKYIVDVLLLQHRLVIEADGSSHVHRAARDRDAQRDIDLIAAGLKVVRFSYDSLEADADNCVKSLGFPAEKSPRWIERGHHESFGLRSSVISGKVKADDDIV